MNLSENSLMREPEQHPAIVQPNAESLALVKDRALTRRQIHSLTQAPKHTDEISKVRGDLALLMNPEALKDPVAQAVERMLVVNKLLQLMGNRREVVGVSAFGRTVITNLGEGRLQVTATTAEGSYQYVVDNDGHIEGGSSSAEAALVGGGELNPQTLVRIVDTLGQLSVAH